MKLSLIIYLYRIFYSAKTWSGIHRVSESANMKKKFSTFSQTKLRNSDKDNALTFIELLVKILLKLDHN